MFSSELNFDERLEIRRLAKRYNLNEREAVFLNAMLQCYELIKIELYISSDFIKM